MKELPILWQRLVDAQGQTCPRCAGTGEEVARAIERLKTVLEPMGVSPRLETSALDEATFQQNPLESNRILIAGKSMEEWLGAQSGSSRCCDACGDQECRTVELGGQSYEVVPEELLVRAGIVAGIRLLDTSLPAAATADEQSASKGGGCCY